MVLPYRNARIYQQAVKKQDRKCYDQQPEELVLALEIGDHAAYGKRQNTDLPQAMANSAVKEHGNQKYSKGRRPYSQ